MGKGIASDVPLPEGAASQRGRFIRHVQLWRTGEYSSIRFLTEGDEAYSNRFHSIDNPGKGPKWVNRICDKAEFGQACKSCAKDAPLTQYLFWAYEVAHFYPEEPDRITTKRVKVSGKTMYMEEVNEVRLLRVSFSHRDAILTRWERHGTLLDREFDWIRGGKKGAPSFTLEALDKSKLPKELKALIPDLPELEDVALGRVEKLGGDDDEEEEEDRGSRRRYSTRTVKEDDEEEEDEEKDNEFTKGRVVSEEDDEEEEEEEERPRKKKAKKVEEDDDEEDEDDEDPFA